MKSSALRTPCYTQPRGSTSFSTTPVRFMRDADDPLLAAENHPDFENARLAFAFRKTEDPISIFGFFYNLKKPIMLFLIFVHDI